MTMLPARILFEIRVLRYRSIDRGELVNVYGEAERIRRNHPDDNVALEDIADEIMEQCWDSPGLEFDPLEAERSIIGTIRTLH